MHISRRERATLKRFVGSKLISCYLRKHYGWIKYNRRHASHRQPPAAVNHSNARQRQQLKNRETREAIIIMESMCWKTGGVESAMYNSRAYY
jgi:hypothetical protein